MTFEELKHAKGRKIRLYDDREFGKMPIVLLIAFIVMFGSRDYRRN